MSDEYMRGMYYQQLSECAISADVYASNVHSIFFDDRLCDSAERHVSKIRTALSKIDRAIEEARERIAREHNQKVAAE